MERQQRNMQETQEQELAEVEKNQKQQFLDFSKAWDDYMADYEATAFLSLEKLKEKHDQEVGELRTKMLKDVKVKYTYSKELVDARVMEKKLFALKEYDKAELHRRQAEKMEAEERQAHEGQVWQRIEAAETKLRQKQQLALQSLLKRI